MAFHPGKCKVMRLSRATDTTDIDYQLRGHTLEVSCAEKYLGVMLDNKLSWGPHVDAIAGKAKGKLGFCRRNLQVRNRTVKECAYKSLCRSTLEYCCSAWDPHLCGQIDALDQVQRRAARYVTGNYNNRASVTAMVSDLKWESLADRRTKTKLTMCYKI